MSAYLYLLSTYLYLSVSFAFRVGHRGCKFLQFLQNALSSSPLLGEEAALLLLVQAALACSAGKPWGIGLIRFTNGQALVVFAYLTQSEHHLKYFISFVGSFSYQGIVLHWRTEQGAVKMVLECCRKRILNK